MLRQMITRSFILCNKSRDYCHCCIRHSKCRFVPGKPSPSNDFNAIAPLIYDCNIIQNITFISICSKRNGSTCISFRLIGNNTSARNILNHYFVWSASINDCYGNIYACRSCLCTILMKAKCHNITRTKRPWNNSFTHIAI